MKYLILVLFLIGCTESSVSLCSRMCNSYAQDYSGIKQYSMGACICDNEEGRKVALGYHKYLNKKEYLNTFYNGCMNTYLHFESQGSNEYIVRESAPFSYEIRYADHWCKDNEYKIKEVFIPTSHE